MASSDALQLEVARQASSFRLQLRAHNATAYNSSTILQPTPTHGTRTYTKFQQDLTIRSEFAMVVQISWLVFQGTIYQPLVLRVGLPIYCFVSKPECLKCDWDRKFWSIFALSTLCKSGEW